MVKHKYSGQGTYHDKVSLLVEAVLLKCMYLHEMDQGLGLWRTGRGREEDTDDESNSLPALCAER